MTNDLTIHAGGSPFDAIRRTRDDGTEYWSGREYMGSLGYGADWRNFVAVVDKAQIAAANQAYNVSDLFVGVTEKGAGRPREDFELSRFACYLVAMNGDPRKPEVAAAQAYFAIRTREAETQPAASSFDLMRSMIDQLEQTSREAAEAKAIASKTDARLDAIEGRHDWYSALGYARLNKIANTSTQFLNRVGRQASTIAKDRGIDAVKVPHHLYGEVNSYPAWIWEIAFTGLDAAGGAA
ncbi:hypothetical protein SEA_LITNINMCQUEEN_53 [Gordonia phage LitninMcQueen]